MGDSGWRWWGLAVLGAVSLALGGFLLVAGRLDAPATQAPRPVADVRPPGGTARDTGDALAVLHRWDAARSAAWASGDVEGLRALYVDAAPAGARDVAMLRAYLARGLVVRDLRTQVFSARVRRLGPDRVRLQVTERLTGGVADKADGVRALPHAGATTRVVEMWRQDERWRVAAVT